MIRVTIDLISAIDGRKETLGIMDICNAGHDLGTPLRSDYTGKLYRKTKPPMVTAAASIIRTGRVYNFPRKSYVIWRLVFRMLKDMFPEEK